MLDHLTGGRIENLRLVPRPLQRPSPPRWTTVVSTESARRSARRGAKICTSFHPTERVRHIFDAFRDEAARAGRTATPDELAIRQTVSIAEDEGDAEAQRARARRERRDQQVGRGAIAGAEVMLAEKDALEAERLGALPKVEIVGEVR